MTHVQTDPPTPGKPLRLWPGVAVVALLWLLRLVVPVFQPEAGLLVMMSGLLGGLAVVLWWLFLSRAPWTERLGAVVLMVAALAATPRFLHESIGGGTGGPMLYFIFAVPVLSLAFVLWAAVSRRLAAGPRWAAMAATILLACGGWALFRTGGVSGSFHWDLAWRWTPTPEQRLLAQPGKAPTAATLPGSSGAPADGPDWPGFRGPHRDAVVRGVRIATDWSRTPPVELWRRPIGPGWSSFAVSGGRLYTQEQRGDDEVVASYDAATGAPVWRHSDAARFWEPAAGAGPRGTPTVSDGHVYALGAIGTLNALDAGDGGVLWSRDAAADAGVKLPGWGFASSPLVVEDLVVVAAAGKLVAYERATGDLRWIGPDGRESYSSPQLLTIDGVPQILLLNGAGAASVAPADGTLLWQSSWPGFDYLQPALTADGDVLFSISTSGTGLGIRRLALARGAGGWTATERWTSAGLKPYFNDFVVHQGHAYGFDGTILACIDLADGRRTWKGGRYGNGQLVLLADQDLLLVLSERGELALVGAAPEKFTELSRFPAIEGKTWNHPALAGDLLLVRNGQEMAAFRLPLADG
ncbi:MAG TPA: PQQ-binding-like beta-propeller repeat protein [Thermoanaerobaculia bacterium]